MWDWLNGNVGIVLGSIIIFLFLFILIVSVISFFQERKLPTPKKGSDTSFSKDQVEAFLYLVILPLALGIVLLVNGILTRNKGPSPLGPRYNFKIPLPPSEKRVLTFLSKPLKGGLPTTAEILIGNTSVNLNGTMLINGENVVLENLTFSNVYDSNSGVVTITITNSTIEVKTGFIQSSENSLLEITPNI